MKKCYLRVVCHLTPFVVLVLLYTLLPNRYAMCDAISYAMAIQDGSILAHGLWHPSHLLYGPLGYILFQIQQSLGLNLTPFQVYSYLGIFTSLLALFFLIRLFLLSGISLIDASLTLLVWTGSYVVWHSSTSSDLARNMLPLLFLICSFYTLLHGTTYGSKWWPFLLGILIALSGLFHILSIFAVPALLVLLFLRIQRNRFVPILISIFSLSAVLISLSYLMTATQILHIRDFTGFTHWFSRPGGSEWFQSSFFRGGFDLFITALRGILGTVTYAPLKEALITFGKKQQSVLLFACISFLILLYLSSRIFCFLIFSPKVISPLSKAMLTWFLVHGAFALFCDRGNIRMVLYLSVPFVAIFAESQGRLSSFLNRPVIILISLILIFVNALTIMKIESNPKSQPAFQKLIAMNTAAANRDDLFLVAMGTDALYAQYFGGKHALQADFQNICREPLLGAIEGTWKNGFDVFLDKDIIHRTHQNWVPKDLCRGSIKVLNNLPGSQWLRLRKQATMEDRS